MVFEYESREQILEKILAMVQKKLPAKQARLVTTFASQYFANVALEDLQERSIQDLCGALLSHWNVIKQRLPGEFKVQVYNPHFEQHGWQSTHTIIEASSDDMPFLVDSMRIEINKQGYKTHFMIHLGGVKLVRDEEGKVTEVLPLDAEHPNISYEAPIYIEIDRINDPVQLEHLHTGLLRILGDVRLVVEDWNKMRDRMRQILAEIERGPVNSDVADIEESKDFLRWVDDDHFTYLGCRDYQLVGEGDQQALCIVKGSGLGVLRYEEKSQAVRLMSSMPPAARKLAFAKQILVISKTNTKSTVHRPVYTDYIGIKRYDKNGKLIGERRFIGLYTSTAYKGHPKDIPFLRHKIARVLQSSQLPARGHSGKELMDILATLPRDDLFQASSEELTTLALGILHIQERHKIRLFVRQDAYQRFVSCLVYVPQDQFNTDLSQTIQEILLKAFHGLEITAYPLFSESPLARVHFLIRTDPRRELTYNVKEIEAKLIEAGRSWHDELQENLIEYYGEDKGLLLAQKYDKAFPASYREDFLPRTAVHDIEHIEKLTPEHTLEMNFYQPLDEPAENLRFKLFQAHDPIVLSDVMPMLENMGLRVIDERPHEIVFQDGSSVWIDDFGMTLAGEALDVEAIREVFQEAFRKVWFGEAENDGFNRLVLGAKLSWREAALLRAYTKYLRQIGFTFSQTYIEATLAKNTAIALQLVAIFKLQFDPELQANSAPAIAELQKQVQIALDAVANLDEDRILRKLLEVIRATSRTNYFQQNAEGNPKSWFAFKLNPTRISDLPLPKPAYEIFVYSPSVEAIHLRTAKVARGGLRWSDRREDFRTEVLGLMKAQQVKNAVIVPAGAKGGFVVKNLPEEGNREAVLHEVVSCYKTFIRGLLDLTDNLQGGIVIPPANTIRYDGDDPYLVVAADKGTATFSDIANGIAEEYGFWLGDAFASGGSAGYDHKKMGITARGAWESVKRHFSALGIDPDKDDFTVVGIGDMSGDVFGNGMLLSRHIRLVAAFDHRHIFLDPNPDAAISYAERERLFQLPRSSWEDYNPELISTGGGVYKRSVKAITLTPEVKALLGVTQDTIEPNNLIRILLTARVDLLWNGGIGTYVKSSHERNADVGDRTNDAVRVNGNELTCRSVAEGGNLGFTQLGRIEYAQNNGLIYTDFIDNSAGVDCSDHEVNCKILLNGLVANNDMTLKQRNKLLADMTQEIAELVLQDNHDQTRAISLMAAQSAMDMELYRVYITELTNLGKLDPVLEYLPDEKTMLERKAQEKSLTAPEIAILLAYTKILIKTELLPTDVLSDPYLARAIEHEFPKPLSKHYRSQMEHHSLHKEIIATQLSNAMVNDMGVLFVFRMQNETGALLTAIVRAYTIAEQIFSMSEMIDLVEQLDYQISLVLRYQIMANIVRLIRRSSRWFLRNNKDLIFDIAGAIQLYKQNIIELNQDLPSLLVGSEYEAWDKSVNYYKESAIPAKDAVRFAAIKNQYALLDIIAAANENGFSVKDVAVAYFAVGEYLELSWLREQITSQPVQKQWDAMARSTIRDDLDFQQRILAIAVLKSSGKLTDIKIQFKEWASQHQAFIVRWQQLLTDLKATTNPEFIMYSVVIRELIDLVRYHKKDIKRPKPVKVKA